MTSLKAPMRGKTLVSLLIWFTSSFGIGELKNTKALKTMDGENDLEPPPTPPPPKKKKRKEIKMKQSGWP